MLDPYGGSEEESISYPSPSFWRPLAILGVPELRTVLIPICTLLCVQGMCLLPFCCGNALSLKESISLSYALASSMAHWVKKPPTMHKTWEMWVRSLGREDPLEEEMATHSSILAWGIPWTEKPGRLYSIGVQRIRHDRSN